MPYIKLLTVLAGLALLTACGGGTAETPDTAGGNATDCKTNAFHADCNADAPAIELRQSMCLADDSADSTCGVVITGACEANPFRTETACGHTDYDDDRETACLADTTKHSTCVGDTGIATVFCEADPFNTATACVHDDYDDERQTMCLADIMKDDSCRGDMGIATVFCEANPFDTATPCMHGDYADERQTMCLANIMIDDSCRGTTGIATLFCEANPFDTATPCGHGDYADERQTMCLANIMIDDSCRGEMGIATVFCKANWFDTSNACTADTYLPLRVADCITAGNAGDMKCDTIFTASASNDCLTNPFTDACTTDGAFGTYAEMARAKRETFCESDSGELCTPLTDCRATPFGTGCGDYFASEKIGECIMAGNADNSDCTATISTDTTMNNDIKACLINPFTDTCAMNNDFTTYADLARMNRLTFCKTSTGDTLCTTTNLGNVCMFDPFHPICFADGTYDTPRATAITTCSARAKADDPACASALTRPNAATWAQSFTTALSTTPATTNTPLHGFLQGGTDTVNFGSLRVGNADPNVRTLNLKDATYNNVALGGDVEDGIAYFAATIGGSSGGYAGIFSGTDLGAPLPAYDVSTEPIARWNGKFGAAGEATITNKDFTLNVNLETRKINAFVQFTGTIHYKLDGDFNDEGLIVNGTVSYGIFTNNNPDTVQNITKSGILTGLIGQEGAVGVFVADDDAAGTSSYAGGFVAAYAPPVPFMPNHATFKTYYADSARTASGRRLHPTPTTTTATAAFLEGTATGLDMTGLTFPLGGNFMPVAVRLKEEATGDNGFALVYGTAIAGGNVRFRAGLLSGTDLGPALSGTSTANWTGSLHWTNTVSGLVRVALPTVTVDFDNGTIKTPAVTVASDPDRTVAIDGLFLAGSNNNDLPVGILGGKAVYNNDGSSSDLPLIGLIGTKGAIGVFIGAIDNVAGGFQASPN